MPPIVARGVLLDFVRLTGGPLKDGFAIDVPLLTKALDAASLTLSEGDVVLIRTGWLERQPVGSQFDFNSEPGIDVGAAELLGNAGVAVVGADNFAIEVMPFHAGSGFPVHQRLIRDFGIPLLEGAVLEQLGDQALSEFLFVAAALPISGATASPIHPMAII